MKKIVCVLLSLALLSSFAFATPLPWALEEDGQILFTAIDVDSHPVADGKISAGEYGEETVIKPGSGALRAVKGDGSALTTGVPSEIGLSFSHDEETLYVALRVKEAKRTMVKLENTYSLTTTLGFSDGQSAWSANSGITNTYRFGLASQHFSLVKAGVEVTEIIDESSVRYGENGEELSSARRWGASFDPTGAWAKHDGTNLVFEFSFDLRDAIAGKGQWDGKIPETAYFSFSYKLPNGNLVLSAPLSNTNKTAFAEEFGSSPDTDPCVVQFVSPQGGVMGDLDGDGMVTPRDNAILSRHLAGWNGYETFPYPGVVVE